MAAAAGKGIQVWVPKLLALPAPRQLASTGLFGGTTPSVRHRLQGISCTRILSSLRSHPKADSVWEVLVDLVRVACNVLGIKGLGDTEFPDGIHIQVRVHGCKGIHQAQLQRTSATAVCFLR